MNAQNAEEKLRQAVSACEKEIDELSDELKENKKEEKNIKDDADLIREFAKYDFDKKYGRKVEKLEKMGYILQNDDLFALNERGFEVSNSILEEILDFDY